MRIRELGPEEYDRLIALWDASGLPYRPRGRDRRDRIVREMEDGRALFLAAEEDGRLVGGVLGTHDGRKGWINRLAVRPEDRGRGIGRSLVQAVEERLHEMGIGIVTCLVEDWNGGSMAFFERLGYVPHPEIVYYSKRSDPDV